MASGPRDNPLLVRAIIASQFAPPFMFAGVAVALPSMGSDLGAGAVSLGLVETLFLAGSVAFLLPVGRLADVCDKRTLYKLGLLAFGISSLLIAASSSMPMIHALRFLQGAAAAIFAATGPAILAEIVPPERRGRAYGASLGAIYVGLTLGPIIAGVMVDLAGWRAVFGAGAVVLLLTLVVVRMLMPSAWRPPSEPVPWVDALLAVAGVLGLVLGSAANGSTRVAAMAAGALLLAVFIRRQRYGTKPLLDVDAIARNLVLRDALMVQALLYITAFSTVFLLSIYMQVSLGHSARTSGAVLAIGSLVMAIGSPFAGRLADRLRPAAVSAVGAVAILASAVLALALRIDSSLFLVAAILALQGVGFALFASPNMTLIMNSMPSSAVGIASALGAMARSVGMLTGMSMVALLLSVAIGDAPIAEDPALFATTTRTAFGVLALMAALALAASARGLRRSP